MHQIDWGLPPATAQWRASASVLRAVLDILEHFHDLPLLGIQRLWYDHLDDDVLVALLVMIRRQLLHAIICDLLLIIMLSSRIDLHADVSI